MTWEYCPIEKTLYRLVAKLRNDKKTANISFYINQALREKLVKDGVIEIGSPVEI